MPVLRRLEPGPESSMPEQRICERCTDLGLDAGRLPSMAQLCYFLHVVASGSFAATARELDVEPSSVRRSIDALEEVVGQRLLDRSPGAGVRLTAAGRLVESIAGSVIRLAFEMVARARNG